MKMSWITMTWIALGLSSAVLAGPPKPLHVSRTIVIQAPVDTVWSASKDFDGLAKWHPALEKDEIVKGTNNVPGAVRSLSLKGGGTIREQLTQGLGFIIRDPIITFGSNSRSMLLFSATLLLRLFRWGLVLRRLRLQRPQIVLQAV